MLLLYLCYVFSLFIPSVVGDDALCSDAKTTSMQLECDLTKHYNAAEVPVHNYSDTLNINLRIVPTSIHLDDMDDELSLSVWMVMSWQDVFLAWDPEKYGKIQQLPIDCNLIWTPDIISLSLLAEDPYNSALHRVCKLFSNGTVREVYTTTYRSYCIADRKYWPFDEHSCDLSIGCRAFVGPSVNYTLQEVLSDELKKGKMWDIIKTDVTIIRHDIGTANAYARIKMEFELKRHASVYSATFVIPAIGSAITNLALLWLDVTSSERIYMFSLIIANDMLFLEYFCYLFPASGIRAPLIVLFLRDSVTICGISLVVTIILKSLINMSYKPGWLTALIRLLKEKNIAQNYLFISLEPENNEMSETIEDNPSSLSLVSETQKEWKIFVTFVDRLFFIIFFIIYLSIILTFYPVI